MEREDETRSVLSTLELSGAEREVLQVSLDLIGTNLQEVAALFYERLFTLDPSLRLLFKRNMREQQRKWISTLTLIVRNLDRSSPTISLLQDLGRRHRSYGVRMSDYALVGDALLWTLGQVLGQAFSDDMRRAWHKAYWLLAEVMQAAAQQKGSDSGL